MPSLHPIVRFTIAIATAMPAFGDPEAASALPELPESVRQILLVQTQDWDEAAGMLIRLEKGERGDWSRTGPEIPVSLGRNGLAWGRGLHLTPPGAEEKVEGDGRAPAGIFRLDHAFGYAPEPPSGTRLPYRHATAADFFVDDAESPEYNQWVRLEIGDPKTRWQSFERMCRDDDLYEFGIVVGHNDAPPVPGKGSAIFHHVWRGPGRPTAGCTAMKREHFVNLLRWLDPAKKPLLIQAPASVTSSISLKPSPSSPKP